MSLIDGFTDEELERAEQAFIQRAEVARLTEEMRVLTEAYTREYGRLLRRLEELEENK